MPAPGRRRPAAALSLVVKTSGAIQEAVWSVSPTMRRERPASSSLSPRSSPCWSAIARSMATSRGWEGERPSSMLQGPPSRPGSKPMCSVTIFIPCSGTTSNQAVIGSTSSTPATRRSRRPSETGSEEELALRKLRVPPLAT